MKRGYLIALIWLCIAAFANAQSYPGKRPRPLTNDTLQQHGSKIDSLSLKAIHKTDSVTLLLKRFEGFRINAPKTSKSDSIQNSLAKTLSEPAAIGKKLNHSLDSLNPEHRLVLYNGKLKILQKHLRHHLDSLNKSGTADPRQKKSADSLKHKLDSLENAVPVKDIKQAELQLTKLESGVNSKVKGMEGKLTSEIAILNKMGGNVPTLKMPNLNVPNLNTQGASIPGLSGGDLKIPNLSASLPNSSLPGIGNSSMPSTGLSLPNTTGINTNPTGLLNNFLPKNDLSNLTKDEGQLTKATGELTQAEKGAKYINPENLNKMSGDLEKEVENSSAMKPVTGELTQAEQYQKVVAKMESDPEYAKEAALNKAKGLTTNYFAGHGQELKAAMQKMSGVKAKYKNYEGTLDMFKKPSHPLRGKPFVERLRPGFNVQFQFNRDFLLDVNPQLAYRFGGRVTAGLGWNQRYGINFKEWKYVGKDYIYGPRAYGQIKVKPSLYALAAPEIMNAWVPPSYLSTDPATRKWVWSWMFGIKKEFRYAGKALGSTQVLYNAYDPRHQSPYVSKLNIRIGFEFPLKKKPARKNS